MFSATNWEMQDLAMKMGKAIGKLVDGLYKMAASQLQPSFLNSAAMNIKNMSTSYVNQWHYRLGYPSLNVLSHIPYISVT